MNKSFAKHALSPIAGASSKPPGKGAGCDLHPDAAISKPFDGVEFALNPRKPFGMSEYGNVAGKRNLKEQVFKPGWRNMMGRLDQNVRRIGERQKAAFLHPPNEILDDMIISP